MTALPSEETALGASPVDVHRHTMSVPSMRRYLEIKAHHLLCERDWASIRVIGAYDRDCVASANEKNDKLFNWQRPTAQVHGDTLVIKCFPGVDYVRHYALIIATHLSLAGRYHGQVGYELPDESTCAAATERLDLDPSGDDLVVLGWGLAHFTDPGAWTAGYGYAWQRAEHHGRRVLYLGYQHSIWGDVAGRVVSRLAALGARRVAYIGKVGALDPAIAPNTCLATGDTSILDDGPVRWRSVFAGLADDHPDIRHGVHVTSPSILLEDARWLAGQGGRLFVDPEIGHMGRAAASAGIEFGFLHVISNNLAAAYPADLSNERLSHVIERRTQLLDRIHEIIGLQLQAIPPLRSRRRHIPMTAQPAGKLITVAGIDGAGKSTLAAALHGALKDAGHDAVLIGKHTTEVPADAALSAYLDSLNAIVYRRDQAVGAACGDHYWLFALAAWYSLQDRLVIQPALQAGTHVILDNAHHKITARYAANPGVPAGLAPQVFAHLTPADLVLFLQVSPQEALRRKGGFTPLETGRTGSTGEAFVSYQDDVSARLREQAGQEGWEPIDVTGLSPGSVLDQALAILKTRLGIA